MNKTIALPNFDSLIIGPYKNSVAKRVHFAVDEIGSETIGDVTVIEMANNCPKASGLFTGYITTLHIVFILLALE